jgi:hypothetical protein
VFWLADLKLLELVIEAQIELYLLTGAIWCLHKASTEVRDHFSCCEDQNHS